MNVIESTDRGLYCAKADVYIDPWKPVPRALITHGHSDHARPGHDAYACVKSSKAILRHRLGPIKMTTYNYGETFTINGVKFSFHPAGHVIGSAQIRIEQDGEVWVVTGDYKLEDDGISEAYEQLQCHAMITESTFGLPVYDWTDQEEVYNDINNWWSENADDGTTTFLTAYSLGKAQRILQHLDQSIGTVYCHGAIANMNDAIVNSGIDLNPYHKVNADNKADDYKTAIVLSPPSALNSAWIKRFKNPSVGVASGWMALRGARRRRGADRGFILSDHCDWKSLNQAITDSGATRIYPTHGYTQIFSQWLTEKGYDSQPIETAFIGETLDAEPQEETKI